MHRYADGDAGAHVEAHACGCYGCGEKDDVIAWGQQCATRFRAYAVVRWGDVHTARTFVKLAVGVTTARFYMPLLDCHLVAK